MNSFLASKSMFLIVNLTLLLSWSARAQEVRIQVVHQDDLRETSAQVETDAATLIKTVSIHTSKSEDAARALSRVLTHEDQVSEALFFADSSFRFADFNFLGPILSADTRVIVSLRDDLKGRPDPLKLVSALGLQDGVSIFISHPPLIRSMKRFHVPVLAASTAWLAVTGGAVFLAQVMDAIFRGPEMGSSAYLVPLAPFIAEAGVAAVAGLSKFFENPGELYRVEEGALEMIERVSSVRGNLEVTPVGREQRVAHPKDWFRPSRVRAPEAKRSVGI